MTTDIRLVPIDQIRPFAQNPRRAHARRLDWLELSLRKLGFILPIYTDASGVIVSGHQRVTVARRLGYSEVPVSIAPVEQGRNAYMARNLLFNRSTNDMSGADTGQNMEQRLLERIAAIDLDAIPDAEGDERFACLNARPLPVADLVRVNHGRWSMQVQNGARTLARAGVDMPIVATAETLRVVNGRGRLHYAARVNRASIPVVLIPEEKGELAEVLTNLLTMDFAINAEYADFLRYNSFRRASRVRRGTLGSGFTFLLSRKTTAFNPSDPKQMAAWRRIYGPRIVDFGAGHLHETELLRSLGIQVSPFEPYRLGDDGEIDRKASILLAREFLADVASGVQWTSIVCSAVFNSVPFREDREAIVRIFAALCSPTTRVFAATDSRRVPQYASTLSDDAYLDRVTSHNTKFLFPYEPGVTLGDLRGRPKAQKYFTSREFADLFSIAFDRVRVKQEGGRIALIAEQPRPLEYNRLREAILFEFDLPYPDGTRMGLAEEALAAFGRRLGIDSWGDYDDRPDPSPGPKLHPR
jgi:ParB-like chromosome segregation protein Spo0J